MTFHKTVISIEILSDGPYVAESLEKIYHDITDGDCSGVWNVIETAELTRSEMSDALIEQGSDPEFLFGDDEDYDDGQPDEAQEWHDFDPDC